MNALMAVLVVVFSLPVAVASTVTHASAQVCTGTSCSGLDQGVTTCTGSVCAGGDEDGSVTVGSSGDSCVVTDPCHPQFCTNFPEHGSCVSDSPAGTGLPLCVLDPATGTFTNEPCTAVAAPCVGFVNVDPDTCAPIPPDIPPPSPDLAAQEALAQVAWPVVDASPSYTGQLPRYAAGYQYSLHLADYDDWSAPLEATATITQTVVQDGVVYSEDFSATIRAFPREVRWDMGDINDDGNDRPPSQHSPPTTLVCDNPGVADYFGDGKFQDWQEYDSYGGNGVCEYVFWGTTVEMGELAYFSADIVWDLELETHWDGAITNVGEHVESYVSANGHEVDVFWSVSVQGDG